MASVVIEAAFQDEVWEPRLRRISEAANPILIICSVEAETAARRHLQRGLDDPRREFYHGDRRVSLYKETGTMGPPAEYSAPAFDAPTLLVSTEGNYVPALDDLVRQTERLLARRADPRAGS